MPQVVECLPSKCKALSSNPSAGKKNSICVYIHILLYKYILYIQESVYVYRHIFILRAISLDN
jgi:hypothetical protein